MSARPDPERIVAVGLTTLIVLQPVGGVSGATGATVVSSGDLQDAMVSVSMGVDSGGTYDRVGVGTKGSRGSVASRVRDPAAATPRVAPELGQAATPTSTPSPAPSSTPATTGQPPGTEEPNPVLVLSGLIAVVLLALGVWFLLR